MSDSEIGAAIIIIIMILLVIWVVKGPSERSLEKQRREKEHEIEMEKLDQEKQEIVRKGRIPSGRGKIVKAKMD